MNREGHIQHAQEILADLEQVMGEFKNFTAKTRITDHDLEMFHSSCNVSMRRVEAHLRIAELLTCDHPVDPDIEGILTKFRENRNPGE